MSSVIDLFKQTGGATQEEKRNSEIYKVSFQGGKNGIYKSVIRFVPNPKDVSKCIIDKYVSWVKNPMTQKGVYVDDPRTIKEFSAVSDMYWKLQNTGIASYMEFGKQYLSSKPQYASLVQIVSDEQHPELVGQIKVFIYGQKIWDKLHSEEYPQVAGQTGINPFHPIYGRKFSLICTNQSNFNNFDQSSFYDERNGNQIAPSGMWYIDPRNPNAYSMVDENTDGQVLMDYLLKNAPDLSKYGYHEWTPDQTKHVEEVLMIANNYLTTGSYGAAMSYQQPMAQPQVQPQAPSFPGVQPAFNSAPSFPGAQPAVNMIPSAPGMAAPQVAPQAAPMQQMPQVPQMPQMQQMPQVPVTESVTPGVSGVTPPQVTPSTFAPNASSPGMNMDDILSQL